MSTRVAVGEVVWWGLDIPLTYMCRTCGKVVYKDVMGRPVADVYPGPVVCSDECNRRFLNYLTFGDERGPFGDDPDDPCTECGRSLGRPIEDVYDWCDACFTPRGLLEEGDGHDIPAV